MAHHKRKRKKYTGNRCWCKAEKMLKKIRHCDKKNRAKGAEGS